MGRTRGTERVNKLEMLHCEGDTLLRTWRGPRTSYQFNPPPKEEWGKLERPEAQLEERGHGGRLGLSDSLGSTQSKAGAAARSSDV